MNLNKLIEDNNARIKMAKMLLDTTTLNHNAMLIEIELREEFVNKLKQLEIIEHNQNVIVPVKFDEWYKKISISGYNASKKEIAIYLISRAGWGYCLSLDTRGTEHYDIELSEWVDGNKELAVKAVLFGYEVLAEPKYRVMLPNPNSKSTQSCWYLRKNEGNDKITIVKNRIDTFYKSEFGELTESEIKKDFDWAFQFAVPVEKEVSEI